MAINLVDIAYQSHSVIGYLRMSGIPMRMLSALYYLFLCEIYTGSRRDEGFFVIVILQSTISGNR
jgi:hypothetical protein